MSSAVKSQPRTGGSTRALPRLHKRLCAPSTYRSPMTTLCLSLQIYSGGYISGRCIRPGRHATEGMQPFVLANHQPKSPAPPYLPCKRVHDCPQGLAPAVVGSCGVWSWPEGRVWRCGGGSAPGSLFWPSFPSPSPLPLLSGIATAKPSGAGMGDIRHQATENLQHTAKGHSLWVPCLAATRILSRLIRLNAKPSTSDQNKCVPWACALRAITHTPLYLPHTVGPAHAPWPRHIHLTLDCFCPHMRSSKRHSSTRSCNRSPCLWASQCTHSANPHLAPATCGIPSVPVRVAVPRPSRRSSRTVRPVECQ